MSGSTILLLLQTFDDGPPSATSYVQAPVSGVLTAVYPNGSEEGAFLGGMVGELARISGIVRATYPGGTEQSATLSGFVSESCRISGIVGATG